MAEDVFVEEETARMGRIGDRLRSAREAAGYEIAQVAAETRIPQRHLIAIEAGEFSALPSRTYAIGFSRTYARLLHMDEREVLDAVRAELASGDPNAMPAQAKFEPGDPARVPGRGLAWFGVLAAVLFLAGVFTFYRSYFAPGLGPAALDAPQPELAEAAPADAAPSTQATPAPQGPVVFTATMDGTWVKFYDAKGERLFEAQMAKGDSFTIPADADGPKIWTGRPYALDITVGGRQVPRLSEDDTIIKDVPVSADALLARADAAPAAVPGAGAAAVPAASAAPAGGEGGAR